MCRPLVFGHVYEILGLFHGLISHLHSLVALSIVEGWNKWLGLGR